MQRLALFIGAIVIAIAAAFSYLSASLIVGYVESSTSLEIRSNLKENGFDWVSVRADGLLLHLSGPAPSEASRFNALALAQKYINKNRIRDAIKVVDPDDLRAPRFSLELLRNDDGISLIGLIPDKTGRAFVLNSIENISDDVSVTDMLETADYPIPDGWTEAIEFALKSLRAMPRSKISVTPHTVTITAITDSQEDKLGLEAKLTAVKPKDLNLILQISAPRPVITPFSLRLILDENGARFDSCSADTEKAREKIIRAGQRAGLKSDAICLIGLGAPTPRWNEAVVMSIDALVKLGGGTLTFSDADVTIVATLKTRQLDFDRVIHNLEADLPDVFSVQAILPPKPVLNGETSEKEPLEFLATLSPEGLIQLRGRLRDQRTQTSINNYTKALFGGKNVHNTTRIDANLPDGWPARILAGLEALSKLHHGMLTINPHMVDIRGISSRPEASTEITQLLGERLSDASKFQINVTYEEALNQELLLPSAQECVDGINTILAAEQIIFAPSSIKLDGKATLIVEKIAEAMADCSEVAMEIGGHTDSQGRENLNQTISQARAEAVLDGLLSYEVLTSFLSAKGYGESQPIADNGTEEGRSANRRIEFRLLETGETTSGGKDDKTKEDGE